MVKGKYVTDLNKYLTRYRNKYFYLLFFVLFLLPIVENIFIRDYLYKGVYVSIIMMFMLLTMVWIAFYNKKDKKQELLLEATSIKMIDDGKVKETLNLERFYKIMLRKKYLFSFMNENAYIITLYAKNDEPRDIYMLLNSDFMEKRLKRLIAMWTAIGIKVVMKNKL